MALTFPIEQDEKYGGMISFQAINSTTTVQRAGGAGGVGSATRTISTPGGSVNLYLPQGITISDGVAYENTDLGMLGSGIAHAGGRFMNEGASRAYNGLLNDATSTIDKTKSSFFGSESKAYVAALAERVGGAAVAAGTGVTANPHRRSVFKDVALRQFSFNFSMMPMSAEEAQVSKDIVQFFRENLYPEKLGEFAFKFPTKFQIEFTYKGQQVANKLLPCYLTSAQTEYNPKSSSFHNDGSFTEIGISLTFQEEKTLSREDVQNGY